MDIWDLRFGFSMDLETCLPVGTVWALGILVVMLSGQAFLEGWFFFLQSSIAALITFSVWTEQ